jgi:pimeloyl-ACP methyl ester carboxylesterase
MWKSRTAIGLVLGLAFALPVPGVTATAAAPSQTRTAIVPNGRVRLAVTLDLPDGRGPHPVLVLLHAAGAGERDFPSYRHLAQVLPARGIGVLRYDRRGSGRSTGDFTRASFPDLASDAQAVIAWARGIPSVDRRRIGVWGMSQGGWIAPIVASRDPAIAAVVIVSGAGTTPADQMIFTARTALREAGYPDAVIDRAVDLRRSVDAFYAGTKTRDEVAALLSAARAEPWFPLTSLQPELPADPRASQWYYQYSFDPVESIEKVRAPVLLLFGERDPWIPVDDALRTWKTRAKTDVTVRRIPDVNHFLAQTTDPAHDSDPAPASPEYTRVVTEWLAATFASRPMTHRPEGLVVPAGVGPIQELRIDEAFRYAGGQRFILKKVADAEQHLFVDASPDGAVRRLVWIQFERLLPGIGKGYDYSTDTAVMVDGAPFRRNARRWDAPPEPDSDRAAVYSLLENHGYRIPEGMTRVRLVHVPEKNRREELMIIYAEEVVEATAVRNATKWLHIGIER